jgi:5-methylcytosine-specific restriction enzyme subunit McrC
VVEPVALGGVRQLLLREYETTRGVYLGPDECDSLRALIPDLAIAPSFGQPGRYDITPSSTVGVADLSSLAVSIRPKIAIERLLFLVSFALDPTGWKATTAGFAEADSLVEAVIPGFVRQAQTALGGGVLHGYRREDDALPTVRGRIRFGDQISRHFGDRLPLEVTYDEFTPDIDLNRVLKAAIHRLGKMRIRSSASRRSLRAFDGKLEHVALVEYDRRALPRFTWTRLNRHYRNAIQLSLLILANSSIEALPGGRRSTALLLDMNRVFEDFVVVALRETLGLASHELIQHGAGTGLTLDVGQRVKLRPDISWWRGGSCRFVGDVKYKRIAMSGVVHHDLYQLLAYLTATDLAAGLLIYAQGEAEDIEHVVVEGGRRLIVRTLPVDQSPSEILTSVAALGGVVRSLGSAAVRASPELVVA